MRARSRFLLVVLAFLAAAGPAAAQTPIPANTLITSMSVTPSETTMTAGSGGQTIQATALLSTGDTRILGGNFWNITFEPSLPVVNCGTSAVAFLSQSVSVDAGTGALHEVWSPGSPNTAEMTGTASLPVATPGATVTASLACVNGARTGSLSAAWDGRAYVGSYNFDGVFGAVQLTAVTFTSSNPSVAAVTFTGQLQALSPGDATITATWGSLCWQTLPSAAFCQGTMTATTAVHVEPGGGGGGGGGECAFVHLPLADGSAVFTEVSVTILDPNTGDVLGEFTLPIGEPIEVGENTFRIRFNAPDGFTVTPAEFDLAVTCGSTYTIPLLFSPAVPPPTVDTLLTQAGAAGFGQGTKLLQNAKRQLGAGNLAPACSQINAYMNQVRAQAGKSLPIETAATLGDTAAEVRTLLGCQ